MCTDKTNNINNFKNYKRIFYVLGLINVNKLIIN